MPVFLAFLTIATIVDAYVACVCNQTVSEYHYDLYQAEQERLFYLASVLDENDVKYTEYDKIVLNNL